MELNRKNVRWLMLLITFALVLAWGINNPAQVGGILDRVLALVSFFAPWKGCGIICGAGARVP